MKEEEEKEGVLERCEEPMKEMGVPHLDFTGSFMRGCLSKLDK